MTANVTGTRTSSSRWSRRLGQAAAVLVALSLLFALGWWAKSLVGAPKAPKRQVAKIALLPDTPPPPPPPPKEEKKPEPKDEPKPAPQEEQIRRVETPKPPGDTLKEEGAGSDSGGPWGAAASVNENQFPARFGDAPTGAGSQSDRAQERFYANTARQLLRDEIERRLDSAANRAVAVFSIWLAADGAIRRFELAPTGDAKLDAELTAALDETVRELKLPPPPPALGGGDQPMKFRLTVRPLG